MDVGPFRSRRLPPMLREWSRCGTQPQDPNAVFPACRSHAAESMSRKAVMCPMLVSVSVPEYNRVVYELGTVSPGRYSVNC